MYGTIKPIYLLPRLAVPLERFLGLWSPCVTVVCPTCGATSGACTARSGSPPAGSLPGSQWDRWSVEAGHVARPQDRDDRQDRQAPECQHQQQGNKTERQRQAAHTSAAWWMVTQCPSETTWQVTLSACQDYSNLFSPFVSTGKAWGSEDLQLT